MSSFTVELKVPGEATFSGMIEAFITDAALRCGLSSERCDDATEAVRLGFAAVVEEALVEAREPIHIVAACLPEALRVSLFERGLPVDDAFARRDPRWTQLAQCVDGAHWHSHGAKGSELRLTIKRPHEVPFGEAQLPPTESAEVPLAPEQPYTIRAFEPGDAPGIARAFYLTYGYDYDLSAVYVPSRLIELNESRRYISIVAVAQDGEIVGHYALARETQAPIADGGGAIVLPAHRGRDLLNRLRREAEAQAVRMGLSAYYTEPVTDHGRTQHASETFGAKACGITLGEAPRTFLAKHLELSTTTQRQSCMLYVKPLQARELRTIYVPRHHREIVAAIYDQLQLPIDLRDDGESAKERGVFQVGISKDDGVGTISVTQVGAETAVLLQQATADLRALCQLGAIYASLPLDDPGTPALCEAMESYGFFFSGVGPWMLEGRDALRLQMLLEPVDLAQLTIVSDFGKRLLAYIAHERERLAPG